MVTCRTQALSASQSLVRKFFIQPQEEEQPDLGIAKNQSLFLLLASDLY